MINIRKGMDDMNGLTVTKEVKDDICTVKIGGKVDSTNAAELQQCFQ